MQRKRLFILLVFVLLCAISVCSAAEENVLTLPQNLTQIADEAFMNNTAITEVVIPEGVTSIGESAFEGCSKLTSVIIPDSVADIYSGTFASCSSLETVKLPEGLTSIGGAAFYSCSSLTDIDIPDTVTQIDDTAFYDCSSLREVILPDGLTAINGYTFLNCTALETITIPDSVTKIGKYALSNCSSLRELILPTNLITIEDFGISVCPMLEYIEIPEGVTSIGRYAFANCTGLLDVYIPASVTSIGEGAFAGCDEVLIFADEGTYAYEWAAENGLLGEYIDPVTPASSFTYEIADNEVTITGFVGEETYVFIPNDIDGYPVTAIGDSAFFGCDGIQSVYIPESVVSIGVSAFSYCSLHNIIIPDSVTQIGSSAFRGCHLLSIQLPSTLTSIEDETFAHCPILQSVIIPSSVTTIGNYAFDVCTQLTYIELPDSVTSIGISAFANCNSLTTVRLPDNLQKIEGWTFSNCTLLENVTLPDSLTYIDTCAFINCTSLSKITIPENVTCICSYAFEGCSSLSSVTLLEGLTTLEWGVFSGCSLLTNIELPSTLTSIDQSVFEGCGLTKLVIPDGIREIPWTFFKDCTSLTSVILPDTIETIGASAFYGCTQLSSVSLPASLREILPNAFENCSSLSEIIIPSGVSTIDDWVFSGCMNLCSIYIPDTVTCIETESFANCTSLVTLELPDSIREIRDRAFLNCTALSSVNYPAGITWSGIPPFSGCTSLKYIPIPDGITAIPIWMFYGSELNGVYIPDTVTQIYHDDYYASGYTLPDGFTVFGEPGSYAETYAEENGIAFSTDTLPGIEAEEESLITLSGSITLSDGTPIEDTYIYVFDSEASEVIAIDYSDKNGVWNLYLPVNKNYTISYQHDIYNITPAEITITPNEDTKLDSAIATLPAGEGTIIPVFTMQVNGTDIPESGIMVGDAVTFSISAPNAEKVRLIVDGAAYNEYTLDDGITTINRTFTRAGTRAVSFQAYDGSSWSAVCDAQTLIIQAYGTLEAPSVHALSTQYVGESFVVSWDAVEHADNYTVYLYRDDLLWPSASNTAQSTTDGLSMEIRGDLLYTAGEYLIEIIASGYGYSQSSSSVSFVVEDTAAGVEITYPENGMSYNVGDTMHTQYVTGSSTKGVRLLVIAPDETQDFYAPDSSGVFYPVAKQTGDYTLTPYYSTTSEDFTAETSEGPGESITVNVLEPAISSLTQGTNKQYSIRYTGTAQTFIGTVSDPRYTVEVWLNGTMVQEIIPDNGSFSFTTDVLTESGKYDYYFTPCYGNISGEERSFPVYMVEQETETVVKYAAEPISLRSTPDGLSTGFIVYGSSVTLLGTHDSGYYYVNSGDLYGFIPNYSNLSDTIDSGEISFAITCTDDLPYSATGSTRQYISTPQGIESMSVSVTLPSLGTIVYEGILSGDDYIFDIPVDSTGGYVCTFNAITSAGETVQCGYETFFGVDTSYENTGKECWSNHAKILECADAIFPDQHREIDVTKHRLYCVGRRDSDHIYIYSTNSSPENEYITANISDLQFERNITNYWAICIINPYTKETSTQGDSSEDSYKNIRRALQQINGIGITSIMGEYASDINRKLNNFRCLPDYNDISYIYWTAHGNMQNGYPSYSWSILPSLGKNDKGQIVYSEYLYDSLWNKIDVDNNDIIDWQGKINIIIDSCYSGNFIDNLELDPSTSTVAILMATSPNEKSILGRLYGGAEFTKQLADYACSSSTENLKLSIIKDNVEVERAYSLSEFEWLDPTTSFWGPCDRIFFAEDPDAVK